ncbi:YsnF/AvaK domain-containing protein [Planomicrobium sp. Y74]|uniref:YsnF/AvaK domain-containing protein n=1 Tax=Planomicrobium sp. Y74 TaxID=2478977 RepID=UPI000EF45ECC|nr:YsnF/AvaK domain-containing protein [Planomicrobium sp. Y74]RLQ83851.1 YsnF/AvaK domain-containing protein [Planomicrobium sp. Y74]
MDKKGNKLFGFFGGQMEVQEKIEELKNEGYPSDNMYVIAKDNEQINALRSYSEVHFSTEQDGEWIDKFKELFSGNHSLRNVFEEMGFSSEEAEDFNRRIENGEIFLFADDEVYDESNRDAGISAAGVSNNSAGAYDESPKMSRTERRRKLSGTDEESLLLHEEQLEIHKERVQTGEINVNKRIVEEQQHMDVPVERDDVVVERRPVADNGNPDEEIRREPYQVGDELHIPVVEERLVVTKKEVVTEEIVVTKRKINETEHISEMVRREEVDIDDSDLPPNGSTRK